MMVEIKRIGLALKSEDGYAPPDIYIDESNNLAFVEGAEAIGQHVNQRLKTYEGEWFLDVHAGVQWLEYVMGHTYNPALTEALVKTEVLDTDGVTEIESFSVSFNQSLRHLKSYSISVRTIYDERVNVS